MAENIVHFREPVVVGYFDVDKAREAADVLARSFAIMQEVRLGDFIIDEETGLRVPKPSLADRVRSARGLEADHSRLPVSFGSVVYGLEKAIDLRFNEHIHEVGFNRNNLRVSTFSKHTDQSNREPRARYVRFRDGEVVRATQRPDTLAHFDETKVELDGVRYIGNAARILFGSTDKQVNMVHGDIALPEGYELNRPEDLNYFPEYCEIDAAIDAAIEDKQAHIFPIEPGQIVAMVDALPHWRGSEPLVDENRFVFRSFLEDRAGFELEV